MKPYSHFDATNIEVGSVTTKYIVSGGSVYHEILTNMIDKLQVTEHFAGAVGGAVGGAAGSLAAGMLVAKMAGAASGPSEGAALIYIGGGIVVGTITGVVYGYVHGYQKIIYFPLKFQISNHLFSLLISARIFISIKKPASNIVWPIYVCKQCITKRAVEKLFC